MPVFGAIKISGNCDADVVFTDAETEKTYITAYITFGVSKKDNNC